MIPYIENFLTEHEADELFEFIQTLPAVREKNKRNKHTLIRKLHYGTFTPLPKGRAYGQRLDLETASDKIKAVAARLTAYAGKTINYLSVLGYENELDHINPHRHQEDLTTNPGDMSVWVLSLGEVRELVIRPACVLAPGHEGKCVPCKDKSKYEHLYPKHGSLYVLPHVFNTIHIPGDLTAGIGAHEHSIPDQDFPCTLRISINCKHIPEPLPPTIFPAQPNRVTRNHEVKCSVSGCRRRAIPARPDYGIGSNGKCLEIHGGANTSDDSHPVQIERQATLERCRALRYLPRIYDQHAGKECPPDAVNVDRTTIFGNHNRRELKTEEGRAAWALEVGEKMKDEAFATSVMALRGLPLKCWCTPKEVVEGHCHALAWLFPANAVKP